MCVCGAFWVIGAGGVCVYIYTYTCPCSLYIPISISPTHTSTYICVYISTYIYTHIYFCLHAYPCLCSCVAWVCSSEFHNVGPETAKFRGPMRTVCVKGTARFPWVADRRRWKPLPTGEIISVRYHGASPHRHYRQKTKFVLHSLTNHADCL